MLRFLGLLVTVLLGTALAALPARTQTPPDSARPVPAPLPREVPIRLIQGGQYLPAGTEIVLVRRQGSQRENGLIQPDFLAPEAAPFDAADVLRDTLTPRGETRRRYARTQAAETLYFVFARTPDGRLYWSYSTTVQQPKFDVLERGVMSVAPIAEAALRRRAEAAFFGGAAEPAPPPADTATSAPAADPFPPDTFALPPPDTALFDDPFYNDTTLFADLDDAFGADTQLARPAATARAGIAPGLFYGLLTVLVGLLAAALFVMDRLYRELKAKRLEAMELRAQLVGLQLNPERHRALEHTLAEVTADRDEAREAHRQLLTRYKQLVRELERVQPGARRDDL